MGKIDWFKRPNFISNYIQSNYYFRRYTQCRRLLLIDGSRDIRFSGPHGEMQCPLHVVFVRRHLELPSGRHHEAPAATKTTSN
jgi:hypothetical protein